MNFSSFEEVISKIDGVSHAKLVMDGGELREVHILANSRRAPKQIVRDIETSLLSVFDYRIDRRIISIAQIEMDDNPSFGRIKYEGLLVEVNGNNIECTAKMNFEGESYSATQTAVRTSVNRNKVVAKAVISVIENILGQPSIFDIQDVIINTTGTITFVSVVVNMIFEEQEESMVGAAIVRGEMNEAIAKATLDAVNRKIQRTFF